MFYTKFKQYSKETTENMSNRLNTSLNNIKTFADFIKAQQPKNTVNECTNNEKCKTWTTNHANQYNFVLNPLNDLTNGSPLNDKIGKFRGRNITLIYDINLNQICNGSLVNITFNCEIECTRCNLEGHNYPNCKFCNSTGRVSGKRQIQLSIPAGVKLDDTVKFKAMGEAGLKGGGSGDLYVKFNTNLHEFYVNRQGNIYCRIPISMETLTMGGRINVTLASGNTTTLKMLPTYNCYNEILYTNFGLYDPTGCIKSLIAKFEPFSIGENYKLSTYLFIYIDNFNKILFERNSTKHDYEN